MTTTLPNKRKLSTADERRESVMKAAIPVFAERGYHAASTLEIAKQAGISQAYVFRLFPTKTELFAAAYDVASARMVDTFRDAAAAARRSGREPLEVMGEAYVELVERDRDVLLMQLHSQVAGSTEPQIRDAARRCFATLYELVARESAASPEALRAWFAHGMLCNVMAALDANRIGDGWALALTGRDGPSGS
jgi:AcrR family transcriptional regulator